MKLTYEEAVDFMESLPYDYSLERGEPIIGVIDVMNKYYGGPDGVIANIIVAAEHDVIYGRQYPTDGMDEEDIKTMHKLGWRLDSDNECWALFV